MSEVVYNNDRRYPGPEVYPLPDFVGGTATQAELDAQPRLFTWGELKEIISENQWQADADVANDVLRIRRARIPHAQQGGASALRRVDESPEDDLGLDR
jgi:hypothetical protein